MDTADGRAASLRADIFSFPVISCGLWERRAIDPDHYVAVALDGPAGMW